MRTTPILTFSRPRAGPSARDVRGGGGIGRGTSTAAEGVSDDLRRAASDLLTRRRRQTALVLGATAAMGLVALYQTGILRRLPDPPLPGVDSNRVDASGEAYVVGHTPDATLAIANYGVTLALIGMGGADRWRDEPLIPLLSAAKLASDACGAGLLTLEQITKHKAICTLCLAAATASLAALPQAVPEARAAWRALRERSADPSSRRPGGGPRRPGRGLYRASGSRGCRPACSAGRRQGAVAAERGATEHLTRRLHVGGG